MDTSDTDDTETAAICDVVEQGIEDVTIKMMILEDISSSMNETLSGAGTKWDVAKQALTNMVTSFNADIQFGLDFFPLNDNCTVGTSVAIDAAPDNAAVVSDRLASTVLSRTTPLYLGMSNFSDAAYAPLFMEPGADRYLVVVSDGIDSCGMGGQLGGGVTTGDLTQITTTLLDSGIRTFVIGFGSGIDPNQLNAIAAAGGTEFTTHFNAQNETGLNEALSSIGQSVVVACRYELGAVNPDSNLDLTNIYFDDLPLARGDTCDMGADWMWGNTEKTIVEFCPDACGRLEGGQVGTIQVVIMCNIDDVIIV